ncbi:MAG: glycosyltransferase [Nitrospinota bacterium]|nr:glycosyltransferase [Nitrospinota bacterium]
MIDILAERERSLLHYWEKVDSFLPLRLNWRAQIARHLFHLLPGESLLELGCGDGRWAQKISEVNHNTNPICAATFDPECHEKLKNQNLSSNIEPVLLDSLPGSLKDRQFDYIVAWHMLPNENYSQLLLSIKRFLKPGGQFLLFEPNPWNPYYQLRKFFSKLLPFKKFKGKRAAFNRIQMMSILSEIGFTGIKILPYDFLFPPIPKFMMQPMQNLSLILENTPYLRNFSGDLYLHGQKPAPDGWSRPKVNLARHENLKKRVSVVVPCHNEEANILPLVESLRGYYDDYLHEIVLVDDNSRDRTAEVAERLGQEDPRIKLVRRSMPNGVGRALRDGLAAAEGDYILLMDCDFQHILPELTGLFEAASEGADVAIGSRFSRDSILLNYPFTKILANRTFHILARILFWKDLRDLTNNLKLMKQEVARNLHLESDDFAANAETGLQPLLLGYKVVEVPISWINRSADMGFSSFNLVNTGPNYLKVFFRLFIRRFLRKDVVAQPTKQAKPNIL